MLWPLRLRSNSTLRAEYVECTTVLRSLDIPITVILIITVLSSLCAFLSSDCTIMNRLQRLAFDMSRSVSGILADQLAPSEQMQFSVHPYRPTALDSWKQLSHTVARRTARCILDAPFRPAAWQTLRTSVHSTPSPYLAMRASLTPFL